ncbi:MAG: M50 family metallopeptidase [Clostridia bacterium]|nr:M50 family metallopeptidase [Clostridia bacterium]
MIVSAIITIAAFSVIIILHELGHFLTAKKFGVLVHEFAVGMGPKILSVKRGETMYSLRLLPLGGFCRMEGENSENDGERSFFKLCPPKRVVVILSGATMNLLLGFLLFTIINCTSGAVRTSVIAGAVENTAAYAAGLREGDEIVRLNSTKTHLGSDIDFFMLRNGAQEVEVTFRRGGEEKIVSVMPTEDGGRYILGVLISPMQQTFFGNLKYAFYETLYVVKLVVFSLGELVMGRMGINELSSPIEIAGVVDNVKNTQSASLAWQTLVWLFALISVNLGVINLLPFPALDGGNALVIFLEFITKRKIPENVLAVLNFIGLSLIMLLAIIVMLSDIGKLVTG